MYNDTFRDETYMARLKNFLFEEYGIRVRAIAPAKRGYYGETWKVTGEGGTYFIKLDGIARHRDRFKNSLFVIDDLTQRGIDFVGKVVKTLGGQLFGEWDGAVMGVFEWTDGENVETDGTKILEYQMLCKVYPLTRPGLPILTASFSTDAAKRFFESWASMKAAPRNGGDRAILSIFEKYAARIHHCAARLEEFASVCQENPGDFYLTHGDAGGNFFVSGDRYYIFDWDEVMYAPLERDAWVMCCKDWARRWFDKALEISGIPYRLRPERLAFYCYHMYFFYLNEFLDDHALYDMSVRIEDYFKDGWILDRIRYADGL